MTDSGTFGAYVSTSRGARSDAYVLITPANHFPARLPGFDGVVVTKLTTPRNGRARFGAYLLDLDADGHTTTPIAPGFEHFLYVRAGSLSLRIDGAEHALAADDFAYLPDTATMELRAGSPTARVLWIKRPYEAVSGVAGPPSLVGSVARVEQLPTSVEGLGRRELIPAGDARFDFNMSILAFEPGTLFQKVEVHDEEHALYMLHGQGLYHLDDNFHEVQADDYVYMAPYCPQYYYAIGRAPSAYLLYKDVFRDGF